MSNIQAGSAEPTYTPIQTRIIELLRRGQKNWSRDDHGTESPESYQADLIIAEFNLDGMTIEDLVGKLTELHGPQAPEAAHGWADDLLLAYINDERVTEAFGKIEKWYA